jgi:hypothetical protein
LQTKLRILAKFEHSSSYYGEFSKNGCFTTRVMESVPMDQMTRFFDCRYVFLLYSATERFFSNFGLFQVKNWFFIFSLKFQPKYHRILNFWCKTRNQRTILNFILISTKISKKNYFSNFQIFSFFHVSGNEVKNNVFYVFLFLHFFYFS